MNKTKIEWTDYTINPIKGLCKGGCWYCYARRMYKRFNWNEEIRFIPEELDKIKRIKKPSRIFLCSTHDLFGEWIPDLWIFKIITELHRYPQHTFQFLTKNPQRYKEFSFPSNCWLGETITQRDKALYPLSPYAIGEKNIRFVSFEPLLGNVILSTFYSYDWIIIGAMTGQASQKCQPQLEWIENILLQADRFNISVFMKDNLKKVWKDELRQEFPIN